MRPANDSYAMAAERLLAHPAWIHGAVTIAVRSLAPVCCTRDGLPKVFILSLNNYPSSEHTLSQTQSGHAAGQRQTYHGYEVAAVLSCMT